MAYTPPTYAPSGSIFGTTAATTPYTYGNLLPSTSSYNIWGSKGNPYITAGPTYTPGSGTPIVPRPVAPVPRVVQPVDSGGDSAWTNGGSSTTPEQYGLLRSYPSSHIKGGPTAIQVKADNLPFPLISIHSIDSLRHLMQTGRGGAYTDPHWVHFDPMSLFSLRNRS